MPRFYFCAGILGSVLLRQACYYAGGYMVYVTTDHHFSFLSLAPLFSLRSSRFGVQTGGIIVISDGTFLLDLCLYCKTSVYYGMWDSIGPMSAFWVKLPAFQNKTSTILGMLLYKYSSIVPKTTKNFGFLLWIKFNWRGGQSIFLEIVEICRTGFYPCLCTNHRKHTDSSSLFSH